MSSTAASYLILFLAPLLAGAAPAISTSSVRRGQCDGVAYNYLRSVASAAACQQLCDCDTECGHWSYHEAEHSPHHAHCYLYTAASCDGLRYRGKESHWTSGSALASCPHPQIITPITAFFRAS